MEGERTTGGKETAEKFEGRRMYLLPHVTCEPWTHWKRGCLLTSYRRKKRERDSSRSKRGSICYRGKCQARRTLRLGASCLQCAICSSSSLDDSKFFRFTHHTPLVPPQSESNRVYGEISGLFDLDVSAAAIPLPL